MQKLALLALFFILLTLSISSANAEEPKISYDRGTKLEFPDAGFKTKLNIQLQPKYSYTDNDNEEEGSDQDKNDFEMRRARLMLSGDALDGDVSFRLQNDFVGDTDDDGKKDSDLLDAWLQWNIDEAAKLRMGQFKVPFSRQFLSSSSSLQFIERSIASEAFDVGRQAGVGALGKIGDGIDYMTSITNGESDDEGANRDGQDTDLLWAATVSASRGGYNREIEGDVDHTAGLAWTAGTGVSFGKGENDNVDTDTTRLGADLGLKSEGFSLQGEYYYRQIDPDAGSTADDQGFYIQTGYFVVPKEWEIAARFAAIFPDRDGLTNDIVEYTLVIGRFLRGHDFKIQTGVTFIEEDRDGGGSSDEFRYELMASAFL